jgi:oxazoline/thiazoline synthase
MTSKSGPFQVVANAIGSGKSTEEIFGILAGEQSSEETAAALKWLFSFELLSVTVPPREPAHFELTWACDFFGDITARLIALVEAVVCDLQEMNVLSNCPVYCVAGWYPLAVLPKGTDASVQSTSVFLDVASGRGRTRAEATLSCLAEAAERYGCQWFGDEKLIVSSVQEVGSAGVAPHVLLQYSNTQYECRNEMNQGLPATQLIPVKLRVDQPIAWVMPDSKLSTAQKLIPARYGIMAFQDDDEPEYCVADSSGCSVGQTLEDAAVRGFFELVERDAVALWWYNCARRPPVPESDLVDPLVQDVLVWASKRGRSLHFLDLTTDFGIAVVAAISCSEARDQLAFGFAAASSLAAAARSAAGELVQFEINSAFVAAAQAKSAEGATPKAWSLLNWSQSALIEQHPHLQPDSFLPHLEVTSSAWNVEQCHAICRSMDLDFLVLNLTRPDIAIPTTRTVVPGLRSHWPRFSEGRLYDVPVSLGWLPQRLTEKDFNPVAIRY